MYPDRTTCWVWSSSSASLVDFYVVCGLCFSFLVPTFWPCYSLPLFARNRVTHTWNNSEEKEEKQKNNDHFPPHLINAVVSNYPRPPISIVSKSPNSLACGAIFHLLWPIEFKYITKFKTESWFSTLYLYNPPLCGIFHSVDLLYPNPPTVSQHLYIVTISFSPHLFWIFYSFFRSGVG